MTVQTIELAGQRFVILPEPDFRELERRVSAQIAPSTTQASTTARRFDPVVPFDISGESASDMLTRERR